MEVNESNSIDDEKYDLISVKIYDGVSYFKDDVKDLSDILEKFNNTKTPFVDMGNRITEAVYAQLEQSDKVMKSVEFDVNDKIISVYEINCISENERTEKNTSMAFIDMETMEPVRRFNHAR